ncbi:MAG: hypothetical protein JXB03_01525 [Spirochaetales bacterium]|nr:hypothetical protein [Spirochaetales bacterium]
MDMMKQTVVYKILFAVTVLATLGGLLTLLPHSGASYPNVMYYSSLCTFAPAATLYCFFIAGSVCFFRSSFVKDRDGSPAERLKRHKKSLLPLILLLAAALASTFWFTQVKSRYVDAAAQASTVSE